MAYDSTTLSSEVEDDVVSTIYSARPEASPPTVRPSTVSAKSGESVAWMESPTPHGREETEPTAENAAKSEFIAAKTVAVVEAPASGQGPADHARHVTRWY